MKNLLFGILLIVCFSLTSCGDNADCTKCSASISNIDTEQEICQDGDDLTVKTTTLGISSTETISGANKSNYVAGLVADGYTCN